jgi:DNA-binding transcriptional regulator YhcF (GntR family)
MMIFCTQKLLPVLRDRLKHGLLKPGDKLLSVRALSREQGISISTAYKAYVELENMGMIEARPKVRLLCEILAGEV